MAHQRQTPLSWGGVCVAVRPLPDELPAAPSSTGSCGSFIRTGRPAARERLPSVREMAGRSRRERQHGPRASTRGSRTTASSSPVRARDLRLRRRPPLAELGELAAAALAGARVDEGVEARSSRSHICTRSSSHAPDGPAPVRARHDGLDFPEPALEPDRATPGSRPRVCRRRELRRQIARLEAELAAFPRELQPPPDPGLLTPTAAGSPGVEELERTRDSLLDPDRRGPRGGQIASACARAPRARIRDAMVADPEANRWELGLERADIGDPGCKEWRVTPRDQPRLECRWAGGA